MPELFEASRLIGCILELPSSRARKSEIRKSKPETNPKHQAGNDPNHYPAGGSWPWIIGHLNLFRVSGFGFRIWDHRGPNHRCQNHASARWSSRDAPGAVGGLHEQNTKRIP